jgi:putative phosphonate metabolism protein
MASRYALYYSPETGSPLATFGASWLGRSIDGQLVIPPPLKRISEATWATATAAPRRYGFHATVKPPFSLASNVTERDLFDAVEAFCRNTPAVPLGSLTLKTLSGFLALLPGNNDRIGGFAGECVRTFDRFRAPLTKEEITRRRPEELTDRQKILLCQWGYPYVMEEYRFHMTLTGKLPGAETELFIEELERRFASLREQSISIESLCIFRQQTPESDFIVTDRYTLNGR